MQPSRGYLIRALHEWILDNDCTPHIVVDAEIQGVMVPSQFVTDGQIVLNVSPGAVQGLSLDVDSVSFSARFGGVPVNVYVPVVAVLAIYARENGMGMGFGAEPGVEAFDLELPDPDDEPPKPSAPKSGPKAVDGKGKGAKTSSRASLKVVK